MGKLTCFVLLGFLVVSNVNASESSTRENVLISTLLQMNKSLSVIAFLCWSKEKVVKLMESVSSNGFRLVVVWPPNVDNIAIASEDANHIVFIADTECEGMAQIFYSAESKLFFRAPFSWLILHEFVAGNTFNASNVIMNHQGSECIDYMLMLNHDKVIPVVMRNLDLIVDSDVKILANYGCEHCWCIYFVYKRYPGDNWRFEIGRNNLREVPQAVRRMDLEGAPIRVCYVLTVNDSINHLDDYKDSHVDTITKVNYILTSHAIKILNGTRITSFQNTWGYKDSRGRWNGMMGEFTTDQADLGGSPLFFTADRVSVIDYFAMPTPTRSKFVFRQPKLSYMSNVFLLPFRQSIWICSAVLLVLLAIALLVAARFEGRSDADTLKPHPSDVTLMAIGAMCQQGSDVSLKGCVGRIVILILFLSLMFLYTSYAANIVALLQSSSSRIKTLPDLLNSRLKFSVHDTVFNRHYFSTATESVRKSIYEKKVAPPGVTPRFVPLRDGIQKLRQGLFAFHMETGVGYKIVEELFYENDKCGLQEIQYLQVIDPWLAVQKNSTYKEMFKIGFRRLQESGIQAREHWKLYTKKPRCTGTNSNFVSVGIVDCMPAMTLLLYGFAAAVIILIIEVIWKVRKRMQKKSDHLGGKFSINNHKYNENFH